MPTWLIIAIIIILFVWTIIDGLSWYRTFKYWDRCSLRGIKFELSSTAFRGTTIIACSWVFLICYAIFH